ncbi:uncharacterized protein MICPUCDRAFT_43173 [Micromonas pusilla CCMP1545]|uniref:Predicted protein n=1 Tax=Micromonas pusilla (strain CCMP1545) TaxID=564608 RepID=C1N7T6_MICPC|nr:uncharacterized protein MICPUCDRAFT_43173 [Micromonas pusilla CCMP1545]EEH51770.1 predicted protein [Micromonas pusilla CCMP1545]|eukprot:XP_003064148.1 predicted protein [Micromonas pusilla CCMP1545]
MGLRRGPPSIQFEQNLRTQHVDSNHVQPLVDLAQWSQCIETRPCSPAKHAAQVKRDAVQGLYVLARSEGNKEVMGAMGALTALMELVFKSEKNPTAFIVESPSKPPARRRRPSGANAASRLGPGRGSIAEETIAEEGAEKAEGEGGIDRGRTNRNADAAAAAPDPPDPPKPSTPPATLPLTPTHASPKPRLISDLVDLDPAAAASSASDPSLKEEKSRPTGDLKLTRLAAAAVAALLTNASNQERFVEMGGLEMTCDLIEITKNAELLCCLASILDNLSRHKKFQTRFVDGETLSSVLSLALRTNADVRVAAHAVSCLRRVASNPENQTRWPAAALETLIVWLEYFEGNDKIPAMVIEALAYLCEEVEENRTRVRDLDGIALIGGYLDLDKHDDDVRLCAMKCVRCIAESDSCKRAVAVPEILTNFRAIVELNAMTNDVEQLREAMLVATSIAECEENKILLVECGYHEALFKVLDMISDRTFHRNCTKFLKELCEDDDCREAMIPYMYRIVTHVCSSDDFVTQMYSTLMLCELSQKPSTLDAIMKHCHRVCATLDRWLANPLPDEKFQRHVVELAALLAVHDKAKLEICTGEREIVPGSKDELDGLAAGKFKILDSCVALTRSKNATLQKAAATFIAALSAGVGDSGDFARQSLVNAGALWRLKALANEARAVETMEIAGEVLEKNLVTHVSALRIQKLFRAKLAARALTKRKEEAAAKNAPKAWVDPRSSRASSSASLASLASTAAQKRAEGGGP